MPASTTLQGVGSGPRWRRLRGLSRALRRFATLPAHERNLLMVAAPTVCVMRVALYVAPTRWLLRTVSGRSVRPHPQGDPSEPMLVGRAVRRAARMVPRATCLTQALATLWLMAPRGYRGTLRIGVKQGSAGEWQAHAWVESGSQIVIGHRGVSEYAVMPGLERALWLR